MQRNQGQQTYGAWRKEGMSRKRHIASIRFRKGSGTTGPGCPGETTRASRQRPESQLIERRGVEVPLALSALRQAFAQLNGRTGSISNITFKPEPPEMTEEEMNKVAAMNTKGRD